MSWLAEVQTAGGGSDWNGNDLRFGDRDEAEAYAQDLMWRWTSVKDWRVVESDDPINYVWDAGKAVAVRIEP